MLDGLIAWWLWVGIAWAVGSVAKGICEALGDLGDTPRVDGRRWGGDR